MKCHDENGARASWRLTFRHFLSKWGHLSRWGHGGERIADKAPAPALEASVVDTSNDMASNPGAPPAPAKSSPPTEREIRAALARILQSAEFATVSQLRSFLSFVVEATLEDRSQEIKGYTIAVDALGRDETFDPNANPIVRVEAARLRKRLSDYYANHGRDDPLRINIPKGSYVPVFRHRPEKSATAPAQPRPERQSGTLVDPLFEPGAALASLATLTHPFEPERSTLISVAANGQTGSPLNGSADRSAPIALHSLPHQSQRLSPLVFLAGLLAMSLAFVAGYIAGKM